MESTAKIYVAGHEGLLGASLLKLLKQKGYTNILTAPFESLDLRRQEAVERFFAANRPDYVFLIAANMGSVKLYIDNPMPYLYDNLMIQNNVMKAAADNGVKKLLFYSTACIYSDRCNQPIKESQIDEFSLDVSTEPYALAKLAGLRLGEYLAKSSAMRVVSAVPANFYGPETALSAVGVMPALVRRFCDAVKEGQQEVVVWGSGNQRREFVHVEDVAAASLLIMNHYTGAGPVNVGSSEDISITDLARLIARLTGFSGQITFDTSMPEGARQKLLDGTVLKSMGWAPTIALEDGIKKMIEYYRICSFPPRVDHQTPNFP